MVKRLLRYIRYFFNFSHGEAKGFLVMVLLLLGVSLAYIIYSLLPSASYEANGRDKAILDSLVAEIELRTSTGPLRSTDSIETEKLTTPVYFSFDPNELPADSLELLGIPAWLARRIDNYRNKGGKFRKKEDLLKIYDFPDSLYVSLTPYIRLSESTERSIGSRKTDYESALKRESAKKDEAISSLFDLNRADSLQLQQVRGIGPVLSGRIVRFRNKLGGFVSKDQLYEVYGLDSAVVKALQQSVYIEENYQPQPIHLNSATEEELAAHPYLSPAQARLLFKYRSQHGAFQDVSELQRIHTFSPNFVQKITPYIHLD